MMMIGDDDPSSIHTRPSLIHRLQATGDTDSWQEFYDVYGRLVRDFALKAGLTPSEAEEVVQETAIAMARSLPKFCYNPKVCRFKTWLLNQARWRIQDQFKKRIRTVSGTAGSRSDPRSDETGTATPHRIPDPSAVNLDALFESEWRRSLLAAALDRVKPRFSLKQFQIFDLLVMKEWPVAEVARSLNVSLTSVYVTKHRMSAAVRKEVKALEKQFELASRKRAEAGVDAREGG